MKRFIAVAATIVFFLVLLGLIVLKLVLPGTSGKSEQVVQDPFKDIPVSTQSIYTDSPTRTAVSCYTWYLQIFLTPSTIEQRISLPDASRCFTTKFLSQWNTIVENTEGDPVLTVNDYGPTWSSSITAQTIGQSIHSSDQQIFLGVGGDMHTVIAHLIEQEDGSWKIDSVSKP